MNNHHEIAPQRTPRVSWAALAAILLAIPTGTPAIAVEVVGELVQVQGQELLLRLPAGAEANNGDQVSVLVEVKDAGPATVATGVVTGARQGLVVAELRHSSGQLIPGQKVRVTPAVSSVSPAPDAKAIDPRDTRFPPWPTIKPNQPWIGESRWWANQHETVLCGVLKDGPAGKAGLQADDTILSVGGKRINDNGDLQNAIEAHQPGDKVDFEIERNGKKLVLAVTLEAIPPDGGNGRILAAAEAGESWAMMDIGVRYANFRGNVSYFAENDAEAVNWFRRSIAAGYAAGPWFLGLMYQYGRGVEKDYAQAAQLYEQARLGTGTGVHKGLFGSATVNLAVLYLNGQGVPQNLTKGVQLLREAVDDGNLLAAWKLAWLYESGQGVPQDYAKAIELYQRAASEDYAVAEVALGRMCANGIGVQRDEAMAARWYQRAADHRSVAGMCALGRMYAEGTGVPRDDAQAAQWFRRAADRGSAEAQDYLGYLYVTGRGVPQDRAEAIRWYRKAAAQGDAHATDALKGLGEAVQ